MTTLLLERPPSASDERSVSRRAMCARPAPGDRPTLADLISSVWEGLIVGDDVRCPACDGAMEPRRAAGAADALFDESATGRCRDCRSELS